MPRVLLNEGLEDLPDEVLDDPAFDPWLASPEAFQYLPAPALGGPPGPVFVPVTPGESVRAGRTPGFLQKLFGFGQSRDARDYDAEINRRAAAMAQALVELGGVRACCRYDGGNDEGFAWLDHVVFADGSQQTASELAKRLKGHPAFVSFNTPLRDAADEWLEHALADFWAGALLGRGFGTGECVLYGSFWVNLQTGLAEDDPDPPPIVQNISFKQD